VSKAPEAILAARAAQGVRLDLAPFRALLDALDHPERQLPTVLVAGTNGKGSTAALLDAVARAAGLRVGLTTSPHLERLGERIRIGGEELAHGELAALLDEIFERAEARRIATPTYFEATIAAAFLAFARYGAELALVEVGLGGRLDATNAADPILAVVTPVQLDHRELLGETLDAIAREKAGIFRSGVPALVAPQEPAADLALAAAAARLGAPLHRVADEVRRVAAEWRGLAGHRLRFETAARSYALDLALAGEHQIANAATAVRGAELLAARFPTIDAAAIANGIAQARWPGRLELIELPSVPTRVLLDAAHNPDGCAALARFLDRLGEPFDLLFGALADKEVERMLPPLAARARRIVLTRPESERALAPERLVALAAGNANVRVVERPADALAAALENRPTLLVACGSLFLLGALRALLHDVARG
jgi:dihydrofolate synthase/folylpolyglutamate synthase